MTEDYWADYRAAKRVVGGDLDADYRRMASATHTFGCAFSQRGGACDCGAAGFVFPHDPFATEVGRAMSRGFDYTALAGGFDEGIHDDEEEQ